MQDRYLVQFRDNDKNYFVTDCAFQHGQYDKAVAYIAMVLSCKAANADYGAILDTARNPAKVVYRAIWRDNTVIAI